MFKAAVVTVSDRSARGERPDASGPVVAAMLEQAGYQVLCTRLVPDEQPQIEAVLCQLSDQQGADLVVTTGGTGFAPRDVTPEATIAVCQRMTPGIPEAMRYASMAVTPRAMLSRAQAGIRGKTLIVNLPGSPKAARENLEAVLPALAHGLEMLSGVPAVVLEKVVDERFAQSVRARVPAEPRRRVKRADARRRGNVVRLRDVFEKIQRRFLLAGGDQVLRDLQVDFLRIVPRTDPQQQFRRSRVVAARLHQLGAQIIRAGRSRDRFRREPPFELFEPTAQQRRLRRAEGERRAVPLGKPGVPAELRLRLRQKIVLAIRQTLAHEKRDVVRMRQRERQPFAQKFQRFAGTPLQEKRVRKKDAPFGIRRVLHQSGAHEHQRAARIALQLRVLDQRVGVRRAPRAPHVLRKRIKQHFRILRVLELAHGAIPPQQQRAESQIRQRDKNGKRRRNAPPVETQRPATVRKPTVSGKPEINTVVEFHGLERK